MEREDEHPLVHVRASQLFPDRGDDLEPVKQGLFNRRQQESYDEYLEHERTSCPGQSWY